ncbi:DNA cytosine methyltransferase [Lacticaseibacillus paracasei]|uniref:DNA (cytosine-5-)-methyltransferase n=1 Tax=Lacticaseibacillus paracasei subsp. paracasei Lpp49 TaxID=1256213 RepID=A0ABC9TAZ0_LACPA|nr:DNA cytosine methyltransferase [Lacticaseibacillus paracasei]EPC19902.1 DNA-cytosine methyltransferase [Lacticaseibacillus paracasei subsp. paracasei Lpp226]EPC90465.1 cytosine methyl transferase [Lacticaseibacillus paracasei subsp. paracasei Lpp49]MDK6823234.1 DNA cytosine methyltransferase [Lacticaseibacillus paracasei]MDK7800162.1 DNA cytosine methyltransferase [Lacticaseibacillus paracasei]UYW99763.1 DNA cytosine methyltransferase [Lacticaseibacillus paracasei subsp. tolerans]
MKIRAVDLFCGVGGLTSGVQRTGIDVVAGYDILSSCKYPYEYNNHAKFFLKDVKDILKNEINNLYPSDTDYRVLMGCAPCQPFSAYSHRYKNNEGHQDKLDLLDYFRKQVVNVHPDIVSMENVPQLAKKDIFQTFLDTLKLEGYKYTYKVVYAPAYGVPQKRKRLLLLASRFGDIELIDPLYGPDSYPTVADTIGHLPALAAGEQDEKDPLHVARNLSEINIQRIMQSRPNGTWHDWDPSLLPNCYRRESGRSYRSVYGRMSWDEPSPTITTQFIGYGNGRFGHPEQNRALSLREGAMLQTFPENYQFSADDNFSMSKIALQIGNAVPVKLGEVIGRSIRRHLSEVEADE